MIQARTLSFVFLILIICLPLVVPPFWVTLMNHVGIGSLVALGLVLLTGIGGMMSFGQAAFVGIAAYSTGWLTTAIGLSPLLGLVFALALTLASAFVIGLITLRLGGHFLPISTIAWGISIYYLFGNLEALGGHTGLPNIPPVTLGPISFMSSAAMYYLIWAIAIAAVWFSANLLNSRKGRAFRLLRGGSQLMESVGMDTFRARLGVFMLAALYAGFAGWLYAHMTRFVSPAPFEVKVSIEYLLMAIVGGASNVFGAVLGAGAVVVVKNWLQDVLPHFSANPAQLEQIAFAMFLILLLHFARGGFSPLLQKIIARRVRTVSQSDRTLRVRQLPEHGTPVLEIEGVDRHFGGLHAVKKMSFSVAAGKSWR